MSVSEQVEEIIISNGQRLKDAFREVSVRVKIYKRAMNVWTCDLVEERALEALLNRALTQHLETHAEETVVSEEFYAIAVSGTPGRGVTIQVMHPLFEKLELPETYERVQNMIDSAFEGDHR